MANRLAQMVFNSFRDQQHRKGLGSVQNVRHIMAAERWVQGPARLAPYFGVQMSFRRDNSIPPVAPVPGPYASLYTHCPAELRQLPIENRTPGVPAWAAKV